MHPYHLCLRLGDLAEQSLPVLVQIDVAGCAFVFVHLFLLS